MYHHRKIDPPTVDKLEVSFEYGLKSYKGSRKTRKIGTKLFNEGLEIVSVCRWEERTKFGNHDHRRNILTGAKRLG